MYVNNSVDNIDYLLDVGPQNGIETLVINTIERGRGTNSLQNTR